MTLRPSNEKALFVAHWESAGPRIEAARRHELLNMDTQDRWIQIENLLNLGYQFRRHRSTSGLVELQKFLARSRSK